MTLLYPPQLAESLRAIEDLPKGGDYIIEPKFDGWRMVAVIEPNNIGVPRLMFYTRTGEVHAGDRFPKIQEELIRFFPIGTWLDGELLCLKENGQGCDWAKVQNFAGSKDRIDTEGVLSYAAFDVLCMDGHDARFLKFSDRRSLIDKAFADKECNNTFPPAQLPATQDVHDTLVEMGWEGSIVKDRYAPYASGKRGRGQYKIKAAWTTEGIIMGFKDGKAGFTGKVGAILFGQWDNRCHKCTRTGTLYVERRPNGRHRYECFPCNTHWMPKLIERGKCSGFDMALREAMTKDPESYKGKIIEVQHNGVMDSGGLRHPQFLRFRTDKKSQDIVWSNK